jgi:hypothetical protein
VHAAQAQIQHGGTPYSFTNDVPGNVPVETMPSVDVEALLAEDQAERESDQPIPPRFGAALEVSLDVGNAGQWTELPDGDRLWRLRIATQGALSINLIFDQYQLPPGGELFIYNEDQSTVLGAFTAANNKPYGRFSTLPVEGAVITLEYFEPAEYHGETALGVSKVIHAYRDLFDRASAKSSKAFGDSGSCHNNVICPKWNNWQDEKRAVALIINGGGQRICTGALVNNERQDLTPYFLSANHCYDNNPHDWVFWFNYESSSCSNPSSEPAHNGVSGSALKARDSASDFLLLELYARPPKSYDVHYAGWSNINTPSQSSVGIHHPNGDIKKISLDNDPATSAAYQGGSGNTHWEVSWDDGVTAVGSSGSPLFDQNHRIVGQLHGGTSYCSTPSAPDWYGKFSVSWNNGLAVYLDPDNTGIHTLDGINDLRPYAPTNLQITNTGNYNDYVRLDWNPSSSSDVNGYKIFRCLVADIYSSCTSWQYVLYESATQTVDPSLLIGDSQSADVAKYHVKAVDADGYESVRSNIDSWYVNNPNSWLKGPSDEPTRKIPEAFSLDGNAPNPFSEQSTIRFALPEATHVSLVAYDMQGRVVQRLVEESMAAGFHRVRFEARGLPSGVYIYRLRAGDSFTDTGQMVLIK